MKYLYERIDGQKSSVTAQFEQIAIPDGDLPAGITKKDQFYVLMTGTRDISIKNEEKCFAWAVGYLPTNYADRHVNLSSCAGWQKSVGF